ncbi:MAG: phosphatase PAP2 family protein [Bryobacterales bacterium]|nr:phosphatase PAP2 family protein [Bryobacterales bacterium]
MESVIKEEGVAPGRRVEWFDGIRRPELVTLSYFLYLAALGMMRPLAMWQRGALLILPMVLYFIWKYEHAASTVWTREARRWGSLGLILVGYWSMEMFAGTPREQWQATWVMWDRMLLHGAGLQRLIESAGSVLPSLLETLYLSLYAVPVLSLVVLYTTGARSQANRFLIVLFLGTFTGYALLPHFQVLSPRVAFPNTDIPHFAGIARTINTFLLDNLDISTSVFPSGHVAVAFSSAFGLLTVLRQRPAVWGAAFFVALLVYIATIYGRYHYAVDGLASIVVTSLAWRVALRLGAANEF